jgi:hypothetical protein
LAPDYIASNQQKYGDYVDQLYDILKSINGGAVVHPENIDALKKAVAKLPSPGPIDAVITTGFEDAAEAKLLRSLPGGYTGTHIPENGKPLGPNDPVQDATFMQNLINKIRNGTKDCHLCP